MGDGRMVSGYARAAVAAEGILVTEHCWLLARPVGVAAVSMGYR